MLLRASLLLDCLFLAISQHLSLPKVGRDIKCRESDLHIIKDFFKYTTIIRNETTEPSYCNYNEDPNNLFNISLDMDQLIDLYKQLEYVNSYTYVDPKGPVTHDGFIAIGDYNELPLYQIADIRRAHLPCRASRPGFEELVDDQMTLMGKMKTDDRGYLLAFSLGGSSRPLNVIPIAINVYWRIQPVLSQYNELGTPLSHWKSNEDWIRKFLLHAYPNGRVAWRAAMQYEENVFVDPKHFHSYRPIRITVQYTAYADENDDNTLYYASPQLTFLNHNDYSCDNGTRIRCHDEDVDVELRAQYDCDIPLPIKGKGRVGRIMSQNRWRTKHSLCFPIHIRGKAYFYGQSLSRGRWRWFIQELLPGGQMGRETDKGFWKLSYDALFPFFMNGSHYIYGHSSVNKTCMISKLFISGKMGPITDERECKAHSTAFPFTFNGKHYFYSQRTDKTKTSWFIQELLPRGKLGKEVRSGTLNEIYPLLFRYTINNTQLFFAHNPESKKWFISQLLPDGEMVRELTSKTWRQGYHVGFSYAKNGRQFMYAISTKTRRWFIEELLPNGTPSRQESHKGQEKQTLYVAFPFLINGRQYIYKHFSRNWTINELL